MGHNHTFCHDLHNHTDIEIAVQKRVNTFEMYGEIMTQVPTVIYAVLAGSLSDRFGRGPLLFLPIIGQILEGVALLVNKIWFTELPLEALWLANIYDWFGGSAVWYLGVYTFAADITSVEQHASRMARFDGFEQMAFIVGTALSPVLFRCAGYEGAFSIKIALAAVSLGIVSKVLWSNTYKGEELQVAEKGQELSKWQEAKEIVLGMAKTVFKKRRHWVTLCILLQIAAYTMYYLSFGSCRLTYLYTRKTLGWQQQEYIALKTLRKSLGIIILMLLIPFLKMFHISDINLLIICNLLNGLGFHLHVLHAAHLHWNYSDSIPVPQVCSRQISTQPICGEVGGWSDLLLPGAHLGPGQVRVGAHVRHHLRPDPCLLPRHLHDGHQPHHLHGHGHHDDRQVPHPLPSC